MHKILLILLGGVCAGCLAQNTSPEHAPLPLTRLVELSDSIGVGMLGDGKLVEDPAVGGRTRPRGVLPGVEVQVCTFNLKISAVIKGGRLVAESVVPIVWYLPSCRIDYLGQPLTEPALWFLRTEDGILRPVVDSLQAVQPLKRFTQEMASALDEWGDPKLALASLYLTPGVIAGQRDYPKTVDDGPVIDLVGWTGFLRVYRRLFAQLESSARPQLCLVAARFGMCLSCAKSAVEATTGSAQSDSRLYLLDGAQLRHFEDRENKRLSVDSEEQLLKRFSTLDKAKDELTLFACSSSDSVRERAGTLLRRFFQVDPATLPCIPCEGGSDLRRQEPHP
jgi:hypothetical protein